MGPVERTAVAIAVLVVLVVAVVGVITPVHGEVTLQTTGTSYAGESSTVLGYTTSCGTAMRPHTDFRNHRTCMAAISDRRIHTAVSALALGATAGAASYTRRLRFGT